MNLMPKMMVGLLILGGFFGCSNESQSSSDPLDLEAPGDAVAPNTTDMEVTAVVDADVVNPDANLAADLPEVELGMSTQQIFHDDVTREYKVYVPQTYSPDTPTPVVLNFHGGDMNADGQIAIADMRTLADSEGFILIYPEGSVTEGEQTWNMLLPSPTNKSDADDFGFTAAMLDAESERLNIDANRVYATGYSNGAGFAYGLACQLSDRIAAIAPVSGLMWNDMVTDCTPTHPTAVAIFNGTQDFERPYEGYPGFMISVEDAVTFWITHNGITDPPTMDTFMSGQINVERNAYRGGESGTSVVRYKFVGGYHDWFELDNDGADLGRTIWDFVSQYDLSGLR